MFFGLKDDGAGSVSSLLLQNTRRSPRFPSFFSLLLFVPCEFTLDGFHAPGAPPLALQNPYNRVPAGGRPNLSNCATSTLRNPRAEPEDVLQSQIRRQYSEPVEFMCFAATRIQIAVRGREARASEMSEFLLTVRFQSKDAITELPRDSKEIASIEIPYIP